MSDFDPAGRLQLLTPDTRTLTPEVITAGKVNHPFHPSGVNQSRALGPGSLPEITVLFAVILLVSRME